MTPAFARRSSHLRLERRWMVCAWCWVIANAQSELSNAQINDIETQHVQRLTEPYDVGKVAPKPMRAGLAGALAGMMIAAGVVVLLIRRRLKQMPLDQFG